MLRSIWSDPESYNIFRGAPDDMTNVNDWSQINSNPVLELNYDDLPLVSGAVMYAVEAIYVEGVPEKSFSNLLSFILETETVFDESNIHIFPNPTNGNVTIEIDLPQSEEIPIEIFNNLGQKLKESPRIKTNEWHQIFFNKKFSLNLPQKHHSHPMFQ